ncbi:MAG: urea ABC transporter permease subunit UrtC [Chloroflexi bacterium]|nr:urea ABC transporter permease subunit UrtC [Chloroflexota bacterium]
MSSNARSLSAPAAPRPGWPAVPTTARLASYGALVLAAVVLFLAAPSTLSEFRLNLLAKFLTFAIVAIGLDLLWGYTGMLSLGHGVFFGLGAYAWAMYLKLEASAGTLPDFMAWSGLKTLPWFWRPFASPIFAGAMVVVLPMVVAALLGYLVCRSRIKDVYFSLITQALALILSILIVGQQPYTGGTNGITNFSTMFGISLKDVRTQWFLYLATAAALAAVYLLCRWLVTSRLGRLLIAVRDDENRVRFCGYNLTAIKVFVFALSAGIAGLAGALFVPQVGIISPALLGIVPSSEMVIWVAVGGRGTLAGAALGALLVNAAKSGLSESFPDTWQFLLGGLFVGAVLLFPAGIAGFVSQGLSRFPGRRLGDGDAKRSGREEVLHPPAGILPSGSLAGTPGTPSTPVEVTAWQQ